MFVNEIKELDKDQTLSKHERIIIGVYAAIENGKIAIGDKLPSVIKLAKILGYSNRTVAIAYEELRDKGIIESKSTKGYFLANTNTNTVIRIALIISDFKVVQKSFFEILRKELGENYHVDLFLHHDDIMFFENLSKRYIGKYGFYIVDPIQKKGFSSLLDSYPENKTILINRILIEENEKLFSSIHQDFKHSLAEELFRYKSKIKNYKKAFLYYNESDGQPLDIISGCKILSKNIDLTFEIRGNYIDHSIESNCLYFFSNDDFLWRFLKDVKIHQYELGTSVGVISFNNSIEKEIVFDGISAFTNHLNLMAIKAAANIKNKTKYSIESLPAKLILRNSF